MCELYTCHNPYFNRWFSAIYKEEKQLKNIRVTILILIDGFLQFNCVDFKSFVRSVTILILIDGFLQSNIKYEKRLFWESHNPYFNRWFSAIKN